MFKTESEFQAFMHQDPSILLSGILDINPDLCPDTPVLLTLGREIPLASGKLDNLFIDINGILTFVECKRYGDGRVKREVYAQAINYASDLKSALFHYTGSEFTAQFFNVVSQAQNLPHSSYEELLTALSQDPLFEGRNINDWRDQFATRLESNIKQGACRVIIACTPSPNDVFAYNHVRNLMDILTFSESARKTYDLMLLDVREVGDVYLSRVIWRNYSMLPQIPLVAQARRDTTTAIESMKERRKHLPEERRTSLDGFIAALSENDVYLKEITQGYALYSERNNKSLYTKILIHDNDWTVLRHQIHDHDALFPAILNGNLDRELEGVTFKVEEKPGSKHGQMFDVTLFPDESTPASKLTEVVLHKLGKIPGLRRGYAAGQL